MLPIGPVASEGIWRHGSRGSMGSVSVETGHMTVLTTAPESGGSARPLRLFLTNNERNGTFGNSGAPSTIFSRVRMDGIVSSTVSGHVPAGVGGGFK